MTTVRAPKLWLTLFGLANAVRETAGVVCTSNNSSSIASLTFNLAANGISASTVVGATWRFQQGSSPPVRVAILSGTYFGPEGHYTNRIERSSNNSVDLNLKQPTKSDEGLFICEVLHGATQPRTITFPLKVYDGATPGNLKLNLTYKHSANTLHCDIPGLTSLGDAVLAISGEDDQILANGTSLPLTLAYTQGARDKTFKCFLTGGGAECSDVASNGIVTVQGSSSSSGKPGLDTGVLVAVVIQSLICVCQLAAIPADSWQGDVSLL